MVLEATTSKAKTVRVPMPLYEKVTAVLEQRLSSATSFNEFVIRALTAYVQFTRRRQIDAAFGRMSEDSEYQKEARLIASEFEESDWEAFELAETADE